MSWLEQWARIETILCWISLGLTLLIFSAFIIAFIYVGINNLIYTIKRNKRKQQKEITNNETNE